MKSHKSISLSDDVWNDLQYEAKQKGLSLSAYVEKILGEKSDDGVLSIDVLNNKLILLNNKIVLYSNIYTNKLQNDLKKIIEEKEKLEKAITEDKKKKEGLLKEIEQKFKKFNILKEVKAYEGEDWGKFFERLLKQTPKLFPEIKLTMFFQYDRLRKNEKYSEKIG